MVARLKRLAGRFQRSLAGKLLRKFGEDQAANQAVLVAWNALFSMFPLALVILGVTSLFLNAVGIHSDVVQRDLVSLFPGNPQQQRDVQQALEGVKQQTGLFFIVGFVGLVWTGTSLFGTMEYAFDVLWHAPRRGFIRMRLMAVGMIAIFSLLTVVAVGTASVLPLLGRLPGVPAFLTSGPVGFLLQVGVGLATGVVLFGSMYFVVPNRRQTLSVIWPGALLAGALFEALTLAFPAYLSLNKGTNQYGATFGLMFVLMTYFYFVGLITMLGAELNALIYPVPIPRSQTADRSDPVPPPPAARRAPERATRSREISGTKPAWPRRVVFGLVGAAVGILAARRRRAG